ncbi:uncharacterized protein Z520_10514 [Fonsecaea multimorphosa CBS 102226]|uniref:NmrA-like domain-containing protein n=1 Tax=Fonsecaea multimorphosa CBS 102226 TaxID=1442371 RepID=A0A0D2JTU8_9EURO|nr:uncharacterized protein Z520_10514 [Fonsecaea multimorphosa CBS 102226]KIX93889.1 hypothetical protein Z520_10514 [Fonsecaea multimorphosa CBS 102226]OAL19126.1 hypothetical protein AYO22_10074 [Fonsecaea multimorphosa]
MTPHLAATSPTAAKVTFLVLGAGWVWQFLEPLVKKNANITYAATTTSGRKGTIPFKFDLESDGLEAAFKRLPLADYVLVTFPLKGRGPSRKLVSMYAETHGRHGPADFDSATEDGQGDGRSGEAESSTITATKWIQLGSTGIWTSPDFVDSHSPIDPSNERGIAEDELISLGGCVLNLAGLYGAQRQPGNWIARVAKTKEQLGEKGALHLIHGVDVAGAVIGVLKVDCVKPGRLFGRRWIVADCVSYDWWSIVWDFNGDSSEETQHKDEEDAQEQTKLERWKYRRWVMELMQDKGVKALPRPMEALGRKLDAREFWNAVGILPERTLRR